MKKLVTELGHCKQWNASEILNKVEEVFYTNMAYPCRIEILKWGLKNVNEILEKITSIENLIMQQYCQGSNNRTKNSFPSETKRFPEENPKSNTKKFCSLHKVTSHNDNECYIQNKQKMDQSCAITKILPLK